MNIIGDIGGTKSLFHIYDSQGKKIKSYLNRDFKSFNDVLVDLVEILDIDINSISRICLAVAAPILSGQAVITNIGWLINSNVVNEIFPDAKLYLLNDMEALGYYVAKTPTLKYLPVKNGSFKRSNNSFLIIGLGTGFGMTIGREIDISGHEFSQMDPLIPIDTERDYSIHASEVGHSRFSPSNIFEDELFRFLREKISNVTIEDVCSSRGLYNIYRYMTQESMDIEDKDHGKLIAKESDPTSLIIKHSKGRQPCKICQYAVKNMLLIFANKLQDLAMEFLPYQGIFLFGGVIRNTISYIKNDDFLAEFKRIDFKDDDELRTVDKAHRNNMKIILDSIPIYILTEEIAGIEGAKLYVESLSK